MDPFEFTEQAQVDGPRNDIGPHVVILGAGASVAAFPPGNRLGIKMPLMRDLAEILGLSSDFDRHGIAGPYDDFESIYNRIASNPSLVPLREATEKRVQEFFERLTLPDEPTLYDHLVLALREKDVIATFNWDPFLWLAAERNARFAPPPKILFLHGNVACSFCGSCKRLVRRAERCYSCQNGLRPLPLLYPTGKKDYQSDPVIKDHWKQLTNYLEHAFTLTIFGYGAPSTDVEAVRLLKSSWGNPKTLEPEFIDIACKAEIERKWKDFYYSHYEIWSSFSESVILKHPRRTCEALYHKGVKAQFVHRSQFPHQGDIFDIYGWLRPRVEAERRLNQTRKSGSEVTYRSRSRG